MPNTFLMKLAPTTRSICFTNFHSYNKTRSLLFSQKIKTIRILFSISILSFLGVGHDRENSHPSHELQGHHRRISTTTSDRHGRRYLEYRDCYVPPEGGKDPDWWIRRRDRAGHCSEGRGNGDRALRDCECR